MMQARTQKQQSQEQKPNRFTPGESSNEGNTAMIPLKQLHPWDGNVRKTGGQSIEALAASIAAQGLIQNLTVVQEKGGKSPRYAVVAGGRRLAAHKLLAKQKTIAADHPVRCEVVSVERAKEISLAENVMREAMHPADQFEAFRELVDAGKDVEGIAADFGVSPDVVKRRLALARVSPAVLAKYREDALNLEQVMAFTVTDDHAKQDALLEGQYIPYAHEIRRRLTDEAVRATDRRAVFVGLDAYEAAGGTIRSDLFAENDNGVYLENGALLERLALEKLEAVAEPLREAWAWVEVCTEFTYEARSNYLNQPTEKREPTEDEAAKLAELNKALDVLRDEEAVLNMEDDESPEAEDAYQSVYEKMEAIEEQIGAVEAGCVVPVQATVEFTGAVVALAHNGTPDVTTGLMRSEDKAHAKAATAASKSSGGGSSEAGNSDPLPVRMNLSAFRTGVIQSELMANPAVALRALAFGMAKEVIGVGYESFGLNIRATDKAEGLDELAPELAGSPAALAITERAERWSSVLPTNEAELWAWCMAADEPTITELLAYCTARTIDGVQRFPNSSDTLAPLAGALGVDMADHWQPSAEYFRRIKKADTLAHIAPEGDDADKLRKLKRDALAEEAATRLADTRWLPPTYRAA